MLSWVKTTAYLNTPWHNLFINSDNTNLKSITNQLNKSKLAIYTYISVDLNIYRGYYTGEWDFDILEAKVLTTWTLVDREGSR